ncbi:hypothetical protein NDU88_008069 [Pleurodeles waltl]|uniref:Uncharacterized protein n=1 Tax=Pleurodeles waltl TaxID=8319 RepID=A0AAV7SU40_PLEWA|nr:hypothetical protein NDU88_008069 [Pleurodeles waltl]
MDVNPCYSGSALRCVAVEVLWASRRWTVCRCMLRFRMDCVPLYASLQDELRAAVCFASGWTVCRCMLRFRMHCVPLYASLQDELRADVCFASG